MNTENFSTRKLEHFIKFQLGNLPKEKNNPVGFQIEPVWNAILQGDTKQEVEFSHQSRTKKEIKSPAKNENLEIIKVNQNQQQNSIQEPIENDSFGGNNICNKDIQVSQNKVFKNKKISNFNNKEFQGSQKKLIKNKKTSNFNNKEIQVSQKKLIKNKKISNFPIELEWQIIAKIVNRACSLLFTLFAFGVFGFYLSSGFYRAND